MNETIQTNLNSETVSVQLNYLKFGWPSKDTNFHSEKNIFNSKMNVFVSIVEN